VIVSYDLPENIQLFEPDVQDKIRNIFARGYNLQFRILVAFAAA